MIDYAQAVRTVIEGGSYLQVTSDGTVKLLNAGNSQAAVDCLRHAQLGLHGIGGVSWAR